MAYVEAKVRSWKKQLKERSGEAAVEVGEDAYRVRLRGRRPAELEKGHQSKASENGAVTKRQSEDPGGKEMCTGKDSAGVKKETRRSRT